MDWSIEIINTAIGLAGIALCAVGILLILMETSALGKGSRYFLLLYAVLLVFAGSNLAGQLMRGRLGTGFRAALYLSNFVEFLTPNLLAYTVSRYLLSIVDPEKKRRRVRVVLFALVLAHIVLLCISQFTGLYYVIDGENVYRRAAWYPLAFLMSAIILFIDLYLLIRERKKLTGKEFFAFLFSFTVPFLAIGIQIYIYGIYFVVFAVVFSALVMFIFVLSDHTERFVRQGQENARLKTDILLAQIQPHFLYNSLTVIQYLCRYDPARADRAIGEFTDYLRYNMDSLSQDGPIPFSRELEHVNRYLELQKLRFGDALQVEYGLQCTNFSLPTLTVQPLVENAVTYGIRRSDGGRGTVRLCTEAYPDRVEISVADTGPGFVPESIPGDSERSHVGIQNVRERLRSVSGGELHIHSEVGKGTTAVIVLPREEKRA